jgi:hypothetical protein
MKQRNIRLITGVFTLCLLGFILLVPSYATCGAGIKSGLYTRWIVEKNHINPYLLEDGETGQWKLKDYGSPILDDSYPLLWLWITGWWSPADFFTLRTTIDPGVVTRRKALNDDGEWAPTWTLDGKGPTDYLTSSLMLRELAAHFDIGHEGFIELSLGKERTRLGDGWLYDDYGFKASAKFILSRVMDDVNLVPGLGVLIPERYWDDISTDSLVAWMSLEWQLSLTDYLSAELIYLRDGSGNVEGMLNSAFAVDHIYKKDNPTAAINFLTDETGALMNLLWLKLGGAGILGPLGVSGRVIGQAGSGRGRAGGAMGKDLKLWAMSASVEARTLSLYHRLRPKGFMAMVTGMNNAPEPQADSRQIPLFVSLVPFVPLTPILFNSGMDAGLATRQTTLLGVDGRGLISGGLGVDWEPSSKLTIGCQAAPGWTWGASPRTGHRFLGVDTGINLTARLPRGLTLQLEGAVLAGGNYYQGDPTIWRAVAGLAWSTF